ncbi:MAG: nucleotidyltransferase domain-containing protein [Verrucomicrobia subdivision 3 bacterium]|nr:nucleotidyltransferase domain-containing protein [Limisphaerales bacterium]
MSGAHLYGFPSPDSDYDLRGACSRRKSQISGFQISEGRNNY